MRAWGKERPRFKEENRRPRQEERHWECRNDHAKCEEKDPLNQEERLNKVARNALQQGYESSFGSLRQHLRKYLEVHVSYEGKDTLRLIREKVQWPVQGTSMGSLNTYMGAAEAFSNVADEQPRGTEARRAKDGGETGYDTSKQGQSAECDPRQRRRRISCVVTEVFVISRSRARCIAEDYIGGWHNRPQIIETWLLDVLVEIVIVRVPSLIMLGVYTYFTKYNYTLAEIIKPIYENGDNILRAHSYFFFTKYLTNATLHRQKSKDVQFIRIYGPQRLRVVAMVRLLTGGKLEVMKGGAIVHTISIDFSDRLKDGDVVGGIIR
eukprot:augustus_masked-scaffold_46-processed-gene-0.5-mRNA-1 protein AED:1.00 eAED:1.00 QI:0/0/0/0/1/1/5/0/322